MKLGSPFPYKKARIEIIPLIDIMFFLLASFMLASLALIRLQSIRMDLPTGQQATKSTRKDIVNVLVKMNGDIYLDNKTLVSSVDLRSYLSNAFHTNASLAVYITGEPDATHGMMIDTLDLVRQEGIQKVSFAIAPSPPASSQP
jgi:biopolymer transport protein ExbD